MNSKTELISSLQSEIHYSVPPSSVECSNIDPLFWDRCKYWMRRLWVTRDIRNLNPASKQYKKVVIRELCVYSIFLILSTMAAFMSTEHKSYFVTTSLHEVFAGSLSAVKSENDFWKFLKTTFVDEIFKEKIYSDRFVKERERGYILNENKIIGLTRLRQLRGQNYSCDDKSTFSKVIKECFRDYSYYAENHSQFGHSYGTGWNYQSSSQLNGRPFLVSIYEYDGGGFVQNLGSTKIDSIKILHGLQHHSWIDRLTRAVFLEFTVYNANVNIFALVRLVVEFPVTGGVVPSTHIASQKLIRYASGKDKVVLVMEVVIYTFVVYYIIEELLEIRARGIAYFGHFWNFLDIAVLGISISCLALNILRELEIKSIFLRTHSGPYQFYNFIPISYCQSMFDDLVAINVFIIWIKLFKYVGFSKVLAQFSMTISRGANDILGFTIMFSVVFASFAQLASLTFGSKLEEFKTVTDASFTQFRIILGDFDYYKLESAEKILGPIYFFIYVFFVFYILLNMFLAIINDAYQEVKDSYDKTESLNIMTTIKQKFNQFAGKLDWKFHLEKFKSVILKSEDKMDFESMRTELKQLGYSDLEIEGLFSQYITRKDRVLDEADLLKMGDHLRAGELMEWAEDAALEEKRQPQSFQGEFVSKDDFAKVAERVAALAETVEQILKATDKVDEKLKRHRRMREEYVRRFNEMSQNVNEDGMEELKMQIKDYVDD